VLGSAISVTTVAAADARLRPQSLARGRRVPVDADQVAVGIDQRQAGPVVDSSAADAGGAW
jgi:hypothetical protein